MLNPSQQKLDRQKFQLLHQFDVARNPLLFRNRQERMQRVAPRHLPCYNDNHTDDSVKAEEIRALICFLSENRYANFHSLTSDDITVILDSGATCCMTPHLDDFIGST